MQKQINYFAKQKKDFKKIEEKYKSELLKKDNEIEQKDNEINNLTEKIAFLNKNIKNFEKQKHLKEGAKSISITNYSQRDNIDFIKKNLKKMKMKMKIRNAKIHSMKNNCSINNQRNNNNNSFLRGNIKNDSKNFTKTMISNFDPYYSIIQYKNSTKNIIHKYQKRNESMSNESISNFIHELNKSDVSNISNIFCKSYIHSDNKLMKIPLNLTNKNYNTNKNKKMINLGANILSNNLKFEKMKVEQKLLEYRNLIDKKMKELINIRKKNIKQNKKANKSCIIDGKTNRKLLSTKNNDFYKKVISSINSDKRRKKSKNNIYNSFNTCYMYVNNEFYQSVQDKKIKIPKKMRAPQKIRLIKSNSHTNMRIKYNRKNKLNMSGKTFDVNGKYQLNNNAENNKEYKNIHEQITDDKNNVNE